MELQSYSNDEVYNLISKAAYFGNLGLFVGTGFVLSVLQEHPSYTGYSWNQLLMRVCKELSIEHNVYGSNSPSPEIASEIIKTYQKNKGISYEEADYKIKSTICDLTNWSMDLKDMGDYKEYFEKLHVNWIITTNYDLLIENALPGKSFSVTSDEVFVNPKNRIPVYHIHGIRYKPESIIISQNDYVKMFRPNEYRQQRLPLLIKESTTIFIGYSLSDMNILTAIDWAKHVYPMQDDDEFGNIIQILYVNDREPCSNPYIENGIIVVETTDLRLFFQELIPSIQEYIEKADNNEKDLHHLNIRFYQTDKDFIESFVYNNDKRDEIINQLLGNNELFVLEGFIFFLPNVMKYIEALEITVEDRYSQKLDIIIDILSQFEIKKTPPSLYSLCMKYILNHATYYFENSEREKDLKNLWVSRVNDIGIGKLKEIHSFFTNSKIRSYSSLLHELIQNQGERNEK